MVEELLASKHRKAPFSTFQVLWDPSKAQEISSQPKCLLDAVSLELVEEYDDIGCDECRCKIYALLLKSSVDISHLESLHAWIRKQLMLRSQCHGLTVPDLNALWVCGKHRSGLKSLREANIGKATEAEADGPPTKKHKTKGECTNSWHLWCRRFASSKGQRQDWSAASEARKALSEEQLQSLVDETKNANAQAKVFGVKNGESIFGPKASRLRSRVVNAAQRAALGQDQDQLAEVSESGPSHSTVQASVDSLPPSITLDDLRRKATRLERNGWGKRQAADRKTEECIEKWLKTQDCSELSKRFTNTDTSLQPFPATLLQEGRVVGLEGDQGLSAIRLVSWLHEAKNAQNLSEVLVNSLALKSRTVTTADALEVVGTEKDPPSAANKKKYTCLEAGVCLCSPSGCKLWNLLDRLLTTMKRVFPFTGSLRQSLLKRSGVFVLLRGCPQADAKAKADAEGCPVKETHIWHVGIQYLSPFRPTFRECFALDSNFDAEAIPIQARCS